MTFSRWLYMNNKEKMRILLSILPVLIVAYLIRLGLSEHLLLDMLVTLVVAIPIFAYKNLLYVNKVANKYNAELKISFKAALTQTLAAVIINGLLLAVAIVSSVALGLLAIAVGSKLIAIFAIILGIGIIYQYAVLAKLTYCVLLHNSESQQLRFKDYFNNFVVVYEQNLKLVATVSIKALAYSFIAVILLSLVSISAYEYSIGWLIILTSVAISFVIYWVEITVIQYLAREYTK